MIHLVVGSYKRLRLKRTNTQLKYLHMCHHLWYNYYVQCSSTTACPLFTVGKLSHCVYTYTKQANANGVLFPLQNADEAKD